MREDRVRVDQVKACLRIRKRRRQLVDLERGERQAAPAPGDELRRVVVGAVDLDTLRRKTTPVAKNATAPDAEIQQGAELLHPHAVAGEGLRDHARDGLAARMKVPVSVAPTLADQIDPWRNEDVFSRFFGYFAHSERSFTASGWTGIDNALDF